MTGTKLAFTKGKLAALVPGEKRAIYYDTECRGLCLFVSPAGGKTFYLYKRIGGKPRQIKLGEFPDLSVERARDKADDVRRAVQEGEDPVEAKRKQREEQTLGELFGWYIVTHARLTKKTWETDVAVFKRHVEALAGRKVSEVSRADVRALHARLGARSGIYIANRVLALLRSVFNRAIRHELVTANPAEGIDMFRERSRDRRLTGSEIPRFIQALAEEPNEDLRGYLLLALYTGARKGNLLAMRWEELDFDAGTWRIPETKNGMPLVVPLEEEELLILRARLAEASSPWVFPSRSASGHMVNPQKGWAALRKRAGLGDVRLHDLRRTLGSWMVDTGATLAVVGKALGHQHQATTAIYARLALDPIREAKRAAFDALERAERRRPT